MDFYDNTRIERFDLALSQSNPKYMRDLCEHEGCYDVDELGSRYFELKNIDAYTCKYSNPFGHKYVDDEWQPKEKIVYRNIPVPKVVNVSVEVPVEKIVEKEVIKEVPVEVIVEKEVKVIDHIDEEKIEVLNNILSAITNLDNRIKIPMPIYYA